MVQSLSLCRNGYFSSVTYPTSWLFRLTQVFRVMSYIHWLLDLDFRLDVLQFLHELQMLPPWQHRIFTSLQEGRQGLSVWCVRIRQKPCVPGGEWEGPVPRAQTGSSSCGCCLFAFLCWLSLSSTWITTLLRIFCDQFGILLRSPLMYALLYPIPL
jgi:hypothetical protein